MAHKFDHEAAFAWYVAQGEARSITAVAKKFKVSRRAVHKAARKDEWHARLDKIEADAKVPACLRPPLHGATSSCRGRARLGAGRGRPRRDPSWAMAPPARARSRMRNQRMQALPSDAPAMGRVHGARVRDRRARLSELRGPTRS